MEIVEIHRPYIFSVRYDTKDINELDRLFQAWNDVSFVTQFMEENQAYLKAAVWQKTPEPEDAARQVLDESASLENLFEELYTNTSAGKDHP